MDLSAVLGVLFGAHAVPLQRRRHLRVWESVRVCVCVTECVCESVSESESV